MSTGRRHILEEIKRLAHFRQTLNFLPNSIDPALTGERQREEAVHRLNGRLEGRPGTSPEKFLTLVWPCGAGNPASQDWLPHNSARNFLDGVLARLVTRALPVD